MATVDRFSELIGTVIKSCGMLEFHVNHFIKSLGKDPILVKHVTKLLLNRRINVLRDLMLDQPELTAPEVNSLCDELEKIAKDRNLIAHNPVVISAQPDGPKIVDLRSGVSQPKEFAEAELEAFHKRIWDAITDLLRLKRKITSL
jgi:hypothetical protein